MNTTKYRGFNIELSNSGYSMTYENARNGRVLSAPYRATLAEAKKDVDDRIRKVMSL